MAVSFTSQVMAALGRLKLFLTAQLPSAPPTGLLVYDTTTDGVKVANNAGVFTAVGGGGGGITIGSAVVGGGANQVIYENAAQVLSAEAAFTYDDTTNTLAVDKVVVAIGSAAAPSITYTGATNYGWYLRTSNALNLVLAATPQVEWSANLMRLGSGIVVGWASGAPDATAQDVGFNRAAANVLVLNNGTANTTGGWLQQRASELALNGNYTNATAGFTNTVLSATVISGRTYSFECVLFFDDSTAADGAQFDFNGGTAAATNFRAQAFAVNVTGGALVLTNGAVTALATAIQVALALTTQAMIVIKGTFVPSGNGTFIVRAAQTTHSTGTLTVDRGSYLNIRDANPL